MTTIDQHLQDQDRLNASFLATMAPVASDSELVRITPYLGGHCACDHAIRFRKQDLEAEPTPTLTSCCGKTLRVFRIHVKPDAQVPAADHVRSALRAARSRRMLDDCAQGCLDGFQGCLEAAESESQRQLCDDHYGGCVAECGSPLVGRSALPACNCSALQEELELLQDDLRNASTAEKPALVRQIRRGLAQIARCRC